MQNFTLEWNRPCG